ncbi:ribulose-1,5 bisphosphate carboxylase/oxygenase large subunit N-methyltransferase, chloroplastic isoform X1 [Punica granatum]|uniref:Ribulose-1,5 bisphosphate carboxylase/oxygenase large subunit N-methyltransferase, chloroplastic isoform X1 n=1 Tax=Punica granatum TaxID=22663 RepID=A0A6P8CGG6_PUNGR|nr:ribulose-1,5 bisphosphate carboxylase/oxygenase large subunit N-methyltransferase, chloroplastic isoform X1 [Punica granatum]
MDISPLRRHCISPPPPRPLSALPRLSVSLRRSPWLASSFLSIHRRRNLCCASSSSETLVEEGRRHGEAIVSKKGDEEFGDLKSWMHRNGLPPCKVMLKERPSHDKKHSPIHYVAASEDLQAGDVAFSVPNSLVVTLERVLGNETIAELLATNKLSELACLALYLMYEKKQGKKSFWYPYIRELDRQRGRGQMAVESPLLWSESELDYLTGSPTKAEALERAEGIKREYNELDTVWFMAGSLFQQYPYDIPTEAFPFEIFKQAFVAVQSCVVHLQKVSLARRFALVPLGPPLLAYRSNCKAMLTAVDGAVQLVVDRAYKAGESIVVWCGPQPNSKLLINYGFVDEDNAYDRLVVEAALNTDDPQYQDKRMVAQRNGKLSIQTFHVYAGKEREAILDMLPYLRLGYVSDPSEMQSVISSQGPICLEILSYDDALRTSSSLSLSLSLRTCVLVRQSALLNFMLQVSPCMERAVLDQLADYFKSRLARYPTTLSEDESLLADPTLNPKKRVATQLVRSEKKMLTACLQAAVDLIDQLPDHTVSPCPAPYAPIFK